LNYYLRFASAKIRLFSFLPNFFSNFFYYFCKLLVIIMSNILEVKDLRISFKREKSWNEVVKGVSFSLKRGETLGLVGESGSGKSVTSLAIMDLLEKKTCRISENSILFHGKRKAMIFQEPMTALNPVMRCGKQVMEMGVSKERCLELFKEVLLPDVEKAFVSYPHQLSGGQRQRVMIAMALAANPDVLIADEPTTALDVSVQKVILDLMKSLQSKYNIGIIFITHDLGVVHQIADKVAVIYKGEIVEQGCNEEIFSNPKHPYTKGLIASRPPMDFRPERLSTVKDFLNEDYIQPSVILPSERLKSHQMIYSQSPLLEVRNIQIKYGKFTAIEDISFDLYKGETLGLVGESGCGKSTLGYSLMSLIERAKGEIFFEGKRISDLKQRELKRLRRDIQIIFQDPYSSLNPRITIGKAIEEVLIVHGIEKDKTRRRELILQMLERVGLEREHFNRYPHEFSGGQRQRVGIARALILNPKLIICDESVSALDVSVQAQVLNLLNDLKREFGLTYIFISHDLAVVKYMSDRMMVMQRGAIEELREADEIYANAQSEYTQRLISSIPK
jgi:peptide/nickel transport system ATP-binding protein